MSTLYGADIGIVDRLPGFLSETIALRPDDEGEVVLFEPELVDEAFVYYGSDVARLPWRLPWSPHARTEGR